VKPGGLILLISLHDEKIKRFAAGSELQTERGQRLDDAVALRACQPPRQREVKRHNFQSDHFGQELVVGSGAASP